MARQLIIFPTVVGILLVVASTPEDYSKKCATNEVPSQCPPCDAQCGHSGPTICPKAPCTIAKTFCACKSGFARNNAGRCVNATADCWPKCPNGEKWTNCSPICEQKCGEPPIFCPRICKKPGGCTCLSGLLRGPGNKCVNRKQCPPVACNLDCKIGYHCVVDQNGPKCVPNNTPPPPKVCNLDCVIGKHCVIDAYGYPKCVPNTPTACTLDCQVGKHCQIGANGVQTCVPNYSG